MRIIISCIVIQQPRAVFLLAGECTVRLQATTAAAGGAVGVVAAAGGLVAAAVRLCGTAPQVIPVDVAEGAGPAHGHPPAREAVVLVDEEFQLLWSLQLPHPRPLDR